MNADAATYRAEARLATDRAGRYLAQFCRHAAAMGERGPHGHGRPMEIEVVRDGESAAVVRFGSAGSCALEASGDFLILRVQARGRAEFERIREIVGGDLARFGGRRETLVPAWSGDDAMY